MRSLPIRVDSIQNATPHEHHPASCEGYRCCNHYKSCIKSVSQSYSTASFCSRNATSSSRFHELDHLLTKVLDTINDYLNNPTNSTKLALAIVYAKDEPIRLTTLIKVPSMSKTGINTGKVLIGNFKSIFNNLNSVRSGVMTTHYATAAVNFSRCCTVLPAIGALWTAASNATKVSTPAMPNLEDQCNQIICVSGASGVILGNAKTLLSL